MFKILVFVLGESNKKNILSLIDKLYPNSNVDVLYKKELGAKPVQEKISSLRRHKYDIALVLSDDLQHQTKIPFLKALLLLAKAEERKIIDFKGGELGVSTADFICISIPSLIAEFIFGVLGLLFSAIILNGLVFYLESIKRREKYQSTDGCFVYTQSTFATTDFGGGEPSAWAGLVDGFEESDQEISFLISSISQFKELSCPVDVIPPTSTFDTLPDLHKLMHNYQFIWQGIRRLSHNKPKAIIQYHDPFDFAGAVIATYFDIPFLLDAHEATHWELSFWNKIRLQYFAKLTERVCFARADAILTVSEELKENIARKTKGKLIVVRKNGVNVERFRPHQKGKEIKRKYGIKANVVVGYAGSFAVNHGMDILINVAETLVKQNNDIHFLLIGEGGVYPDIRNIVEQKKIGDRVTLTGNISLRQIPPFLDACDILVAIYTNVKDFRNSPVKIFEYMAMQKALIASSQGQISSTINDGEDGILIKSVDEKSLSDAISLLVDNKELREKLGKKARKKVIENYTWKMTADSIIGVYRKLV